MRRIYVVLLLLCLGALAAGAGRAGEFKLTDGSTIYGDVSAFDENGVVFRLRSGGFSERISWGKFSQEALKSLAEDPRAREFAEPFIEIPPEARPRPKPKPVVLKEVPRVELPPGRTTFFSSFSRPMGLLMLAVLYAANLLAAYEIAQFRNRPVAVVCGVSALLPLLGPLIFLASPTMIETSAGDEAFAVPPPAEAAPAVAAAGSPAAASRGALGMVGVPPPMGGTGLRVAAAAAEQSTGRVEPKIYKRGDYTFNRRFIETQFSGFFRLVPSDAEKDLVLVIKTPKQEYLAKRISRISAAEMFVQPIQVGAKEVNVSIGEIAEIQVRHKDDLGR